MYGRGDDEGVLRGEGSLQLAHAERVSEPDRQRTELIATTYVGTHEIGHLAVTARLDAVEHEPRSGPEHVGHTVLDEQQASGQP
jgi:hypothetical protein